ncbi:hypothetical protein LB553_00845 [Mesorhizobium sp. CA8]|uniref:hypothetical protein n=1 Tax=Mesorhizobium sp. CA8 TaxID=2876637 RepID=UPI001CC9663B|nr:hypothetical protein [Mesorhizobium sp. CA8]MBZ9759434.1 hypothetical protein [Mesorhizobium sp. CA8]
MTEADTWRRVAERLEREKQALLAAPHPHPPAEVGELVAQLTKWSDPEEYERIMSHWDAWRKYIAEGGGGSWPRDAFESILSAFGGNGREAAALLASQAEKLAVVERENRGMHEALESGQAFGFDPATGYLHADDGGAPGSCIFYVPKEEAASDRARIAVLEKAHDMIGRSVSLFSSLLMEIPKFSTELNDTFFTLRDEMRQWLVDEADAALSPKDQAHE